MGDSACTQSLLVSQSQGFGDRWPLVHLRAPAKEMRGRGVDPPRPEGHEHLKLARLPFRHTRVFLPI